MRGAGLRVLQRAAQASEALQSGAAAQQTRCSSYIRGPVPCPPSPPFHRTLGLSRLIGSFASYRVFGSVPEFWGKDSPYHPGTTFLGTPSNHDEVSCSLSHPAPRLGSRLR